METEDLASKVRAERRRRGWGQQDLAEKSGVKLGTISNFERRKHTPQAENLRALLRVLNLNNDVGEAKAAETRQVWSPDTKTFLDVMGVYLEGLSEDRRTEVIHDITRQIFNNR